MWAGQTLSRSGAESEVLGVFVQRSASTFVYPFPLLSFYNFLPTRSLLIVSDVRHYSLRKLNRERNLGQRSLCEAKGSRSRLLCTRFTGQSRLTFSRRPRDRDDLRNIDRRSSIFPSSYFARFHPHHNYGRNWTWGILAQWGKAHHEKAMEL